MRKILDTLSEVLQTSAGILFLFIFIINISGILCRTFLNFSLLWVADVTYLATAWMLAFGMSVAFYKKSHIAVEFIIERFPEKIKKIVQIFLFVITLTFLINLIISGWQTALMKRQIYFVVLNIPMAYAFMALPIFALFSTLFILYRIINIAVSYPKEEK
ncbi:MAG: hypothetical protein Kow00103_08770 [Candidatus Caldatribacteriota bacterium]